MKEYISSLIEEIGQAKEAYKEKIFEIDSVFVGGGTPSLLPEGELVSIFETLQKEFVITNDAEITVECNPGTVTDRKLREFKKSGVNRISFGLQSADDHELKMLGRIHSFEQFKTNFVLAREAGFSNINVDIMQSIPGQTSESAMRTLKEVVRLCPEHISAYSLIIEEGTPLFANIRSYPPLPGEDEERYIYHEAVRFLSENRYEQYEISNFARKSDLGSFECKHNLGYWDRNEYLGFGLGSATFLKGFEDIRYSNTTDINKYLSRKNFEQIHENKSKLTLSEKYAEFMFLGLRKTKGIDKEKFLKDFGISIESVFGEIIKEHIKDKTIKKTDAGYCLTKRGVDISNYILSDFL